MKTMRLGKLSGEVNVGILTIIEFLNLLDYEIDANPNAKIDKDISDIVKIYFSQESQESQEKKVITTILKSQKKTIKDISSNVITIPKPTKPEITTHEKVSKIRKIKGVPKTIFKYFSNNENSLDALYNSYLFFSNYTSFNDPFDCNTVLIRIPHKTNGIINPNIEKILKQKFDLRGVCCFSRDKDSILMWSHYANSHKGFCIEFYESNDSKSFNPLDVNYVEQFEKPNFIENPLNSLFHLIYTKGIEWKYENEMRLIKEVKSNSVEDRKITYNIEKIKSIYFGIKADDNQCKEIYNFLKSKNKSISFHKGYFNNNKFKIKWLKYHP